MKEITALLLDLGDAMWAEKIEQGHEEMEELNALLDSWYEELPD